MYDKNAIDADAEREANALRKQGRRTNTNEQRIRQSTEYNKEIFEKLFALQ